MSQKQQRFDSRRGWFWCIVRRRWRQWQQRRNSDRELKIAPAAAFLRKLTLWLTSGFPPTLSDCEGYQHTLTNRTSRVRFTLQSLVIKQVPVSDAGKTCSVNRSDPSPIHGKKKVLPKKVKTDCWLLFYTTTPRKNYVFTNLALKITVKINTDICRNCLHKLTTSKRIELENPGCSNLEDKLKGFKTWATGTF